MYICVQDREVVENWGFCLECCPLSGYRKNLTLGTYPTVLPFYDGERGKREFLIDRKPKEKYTILTVYADLKNIVSYYLCCFIDFHFGWVGLCWNCSSLGGFGVYRGKEEIKFFSFRL